MRPDDHAELTPTKAALIVAGSAGETMLDYQTLCRRSRQLAAFLKSSSLTEGDTVAILLENRPEVVVAVWAAQRAGLKYTLINHHLHADEAFYILRDCDAVALVTSAALAPLTAGHEALESLKVRLVADAAVAGFSSWEKLFDSDAGSEPLDPELEIEGAMMLYSSGTTGRPKGICYNHPRQKFGDFVAVRNLLANGFAMNADSVLLVAGPLYHAAPMSWSIGAQRLGATVVAMEKYDPLECLRLIEAHRVTHVLMVPTHFIRMLKLSQAERERHAIASLQYVIHAAAPCPQDVKQAMLDWWGPIIYEFYSSTEANGFVMIGPHDWLQRKGSVGRVTYGKIHILDDDGAPMPSGQPGQIWFESAGAGFAYHKDAEKTRQAYDAQGRSTVGDVGYLDRDGYLYLTDRKSNMIISGGVNIYPQEVENLLALHPAVSDIAVIGVPHHDFGEEVLAVVVAAPGAEVSERLGQELIDYCRNRIAHFKCPRQVRFRDELPRTAAGKLVKRLLKEQYAAA